MHKGSNWVGKTLSLTTECCILVTAIRTIIQFVASSCLWYALWLTFSTGELAFFTLPPSSLNQIIFIDNILKKIKYLPHISMFSSLPSRHSLCPSQTHEVGIQAGIPLVQLNMSVEHESSSRIEGLIVKFHNFWDQWCRNCVCFHKSMITLNAARCRFYQYQRCY